MIAESIIVCDVLNYHLRNVPARLTLTDDVLSLEIEGKPAKRIPQTRIAEMFRTIKRGNIDVYALLPELKEVL